MNLFHLITYWFRIVCICLFIDLIMGSCTLKNPSNHIVLYTYEGILPCCLLILLFSFKGVLPVFYFCMTCCIFGVNRNASICKLFYLACDKMVWLFWLLIIFFSWINLHLLRFTTSQYCSLYFANTLACIHGSYQWFNKQREGGRCDACNPIAYQRQTNISPFICHPRPNRTAKIQVNAYWSTVLFLIYFVYKAPCFFYLFCFFI